MSALPDMLLAHAKPDARPDLVAGDGGGQDIAAGELCMTFRDRDQCRQRHSADMEHGGAVDVIKLETLHLRAVEERRMRRGEFSIAAPDRGRARCIERFQCAAQNAAPFERRAVDAAAERIEDEKLYPLAYRRRDLVVA